MKDVDGTDGLLEEPSKLVELNMEVNNLKEEMLDC